MKKLVLSFLLILSLISPCYAAGDIVTGLVAHWKMNDNAANTTVVDNKGGLNGVWTRNTSLDSVAGKINTALNFGTALRYVNCGNVTSFEYNTPFSAALWANWEGAGNSVLISKIDATSLKGWEILIYMNSPWNFVPAIYIGNDWATNKYILLERAAQETTT